MNRIFLAMGLLLATSVQAATIVPGNKKPLTNSAFINSQSYFLHNYQRDTTDGSNQWVLERSADGLVWEELNPVIDLGGGASCNVQLLGLFLQVANNQGFYGTPRCEPGTGSSPLGYYYSPDGVTWTQQWFDNTLQLPRPIGTKTDTLYGINNDKEFFVSNDMGSTWVSRGVSPVENAFLPMGTQNHNAYHPYGHVMQVLNDTVVIVDSAAADNRKSLLVSLDGGSNWTRNPAIPGIDYSRHTPTQVVATNDRLLVDFSGALVNGFVFESLSAVSTDGQNWNVYPQFDAFNVRSTDDAFLSIPGISVAGIVNSSAAITRTESLENFEVYKTNVGTQPVRISDGPYGYANQSLAVLDFDGKVFVQQDSEFNAANRAIADEFLDVDTLTNSAGDEVWVAKAQGSFTDGNQVRFQDVLYSMNGQDWLPANNSISGLTDIASVNGSAISFSSPNSSSLPVELTVQGCTFRVNKTENGVDWSLSDPVALNGCLVADIPNPFVFNGAYAALTRQHDGSNWNLFYYSSLNGLDWQLQGLTNVTDAELQTLQQNISRGQNLGDAMYRTMATQTGTELWKSIDIFNWELASSVPSAGNSDFTFGSLFHPIQGGLSWGVLDIKATPDQMGVESITESFFNTADSGNTWVRRDWPANLPTPSLTGGDTLQEKAYFDESFEHIFAFTRNSAANDLKVWYSNNNGESWGLAHAFTVTASDRLWDLEAGEEGARVVVARGFNAFTTQSVYLSYSDIYLPPLVSISIAPDQLEQGLNAVVSVSAVSTGGEGTHEYALAIESVASNTQVYPAAGSPLVWQTDANFSFIPANTGLLVGETYRVVVSVRDERGSLGQADRLINVVASQNVFELIDQKITEAEQLINTISRNGLRNRLLRRFNRTRNNALVQCRYNRALRRMNRAEEIITNRAGTRIEQATADSLLVLVDDLQALIQQAIDEGLDCSSP